MKEGGGGGGKLRSILIIEEILDKEGLRDLGFDIPRSNKVTAQQAIMLERVEEGLHSESDIAKAGGIELLEITENEVRSMQDQVAQLGNTLSDSLEHLLLELLGLDKELRSIRGWLRVETAKKV